jgi:hypothetical protein
MSLMGVRAEHPWIDSSMRVIGYQSTVSGEAWNASGLLLGKVVKDVLQHLQLNPPKILEIVDPRVQKLQPAVINKPGPKDVSQKDDRSSNRINLPPTFDQVSRSSNLSSSRSDTDGILSSYRVREFYG